MFTFVDENGKEKKERIKTSDELSSKLSELGFKIAYYIDKNGREILIDNIQKFFLLNIDKIYNLKEISLINETEFDNQYDSIPNKLGEEALYLNKFFFNNKKYIPYHTSNYEYICF